MFPERQLNGSELSLYLDGTPVVDGWTRWANSRGSMPWSTDMGTMVISVTKGLASLVIHRLVDRRMYLPTIYRSPNSGPCSARTANQPAPIGYRIRRRTGLSHLGGGNTTNLMYHHLMKG
ncbi:serine hydrolase [Mycobacterium leprae]|uniref:serine hydrolase n=1 Tax=Mycobacterium leprae TaxID=1769 RepID=UPI000A57EED1